MSLENQDLLREAKKVAKILMTEDADSWSDKLKGVPYVEDLITDNKIAEQKTQLKISVSNDLPTFLDSNEYIAMNAENYMDLINNVSNMAQVSKTAAANGFQNAVNTFIQHLKNCFSKPKITWDKYASSQFQFVQTFFDKNETISTCTGSFQELFLPILATFLAVLKYKLQNNSWIYNFEDSSAFDLELSHDSQVIDRIQNSENSGKRVDRINSLLLSIANNCGNPLAINEKRIALEAALQCWFNDEVDKPVRASTKFNSLGIDGDYLSLQKGLIVTNLTLMLNDYICSRLKTDDVSKLKVIRKAAEALQADLKRDLAIEISIDEICAFIDFLYVRCNNSIKKLSKKFSQTKLTPDNLDKDVITTSVHIYEDITVVPELIRTSKYSSNFKVPKWNQSGDQSLYVWINSTFDKACRMGNIGSYYERIVWLFDAFDTEYQSLYSEAFLSRLDKNSVVSKKEYDILVKEVSGLFDSTRSQKTILKWRKLWDNPNEKIQSKDESIISFQNRLQKLQQKAFPDSYSTDCERVVLCQTFVNNLYDHRIKTDIKKLHWDAYFSDGSFYNCVKIALDLERRFQEDQDDDFENEDIFYTPQQSSSINNNNVQNNNESQGQPMYKKYSDKLNDYHEYMKNIYDDEPQNFQGYKKDQDYNTPQNYGLPDTPFHVSKTLRQLIWDDACQEYDSDDEDYDNNDNENVYHTQTSEDSDQDNDSNEQCFDSDDSSESYEN